MSEWGWFSCGAGATLVLLGFLLYRMERKEQELRSALHAMLTFYGMNEDPHEASGAVHRKARAALGLEQQQ